VSWYLDLAWQVIGLLRTSFGGTGNARGWSTGVVKRCVNATGSTLTRGTLVRLLASDLGDARVEPTTTANEIDVLGVVVGYYTASDRERLIEDDAPSPGWVAVMTSGSCPVARIGSEGASRGQYAFASADDGKIKGASDIDAGAFGVWQGVKPPYALELWGVVLQGVGAAGGSLRVKEVDGSPNVSPVSVVRVSSGHLTDDGSGQVTIDIPDAYTAPGFGSPTDIGIANADGSGTTYPHSNHVHKHPVIGSGDLHPEYTTVAELATGVSAAETYSDAALAGHAGTANAHTTFGSPVAIGTADADGSGTTVPHASHVHAHGTFASGNYHPEYAGAGATGSALAGIFGDGSDGDAHCDGSSAVPGMSRVGSVYTMSRDAWYGNLHVDPGVTVQMCSSLVPNYRLFCSGALWNEGTITATGNAGADGGHNSGDQAGGGFNAATLGGSRAGGNGSAGASNGNAGATADTTVGFGGASGAGGNSGGGNGTGNGAAQGK
jgi:hypothetical protein